MTTVFMICSSVTTVLLFVIIILHAACDPNATEDRTFTWDPKGYIIYCPCMGRFGNQADHFLGSLSFAKKLDRTLILPPWRTYKNVAFDEWFKVAPLREYHRVILAEDFMKHLAPKYWPAGKRTGWCWGYPDSKEKTCAMKDGNPFGPFWDGLEVDFDDYLIYHLSYYDNYINDWKEKYPADKYPVMAFKGAPAGFPVQESDRPLQKYLQWSDTLNSEVSDYISKTFQGEAFIGIHLRNGKDWENACSHSNDLESYMASPQCLSHGSKVTMKLCFPPQDEILRLLKHAVLHTRSKHIFVATDNAPMIKQIEEHLQAQKVKVHHLNPWLPQIDLAILGQSDHFIGNCVSSFTAFVKRERDVKNKPSSFWGQSLETHDEL